MSASAPATRLSRAMPEAALTRLRRRLFHGRVELPLLAAAAETGQSYAWGRLDFPAEPHLPDSGSPARTARAAAEAAPK